MNQDPSGRNSRWIVAAVVVLLGTAIFATFHPALTAEFVPWDDDLNISANPHIRTLHWESLCWMFTDVAYARRYMPLAWLNWAINCQFTGLDATSFHVGNLLFHSANAALVFLLIWRLLALVFPRSTTGGASQTALLVSAAAGAMLWAIHPLRVESVAWASSRIYNQALLFLLLCWLCYLRAQRHPAGTPGRRRFFWLSVLCYGASMLTYPIGLAGGLVPLLLDFFPLRRWTRVQGRSWNRQNAAVLLEKVPYLVCMAMVLGTTVWARVRFAGTFDPPVGLDRFGLVPRVMQAFYIGAYYLWKPCWPLELAPVYTTLVWFKPTDPPFLASAIAVLGISAVLVLKRQRWPALLALWIAYLGLLGPVLGLTEHPHYPSDRYSYIATIPFSLLIAGVLAKCWQPALRRNAALAITLAAGIVAAVLSVRQTKTWHDGVTLFNHMLSTLGENSYRGDIHWRLGRVRSDHGEWDEAVAQHRAALRYLPFFAEAHDDLATALDAQGKLEEAGGHLEAAVRIRPTALRHAALATSLSRRGRIAEAVQHYQAAMTLQPDAPAVLNNLAWLLATAQDSRQRNGIEAVRLAERACQLTSYRQPMLVGTLAAAYAEAGNFSAATNAAQKAADLAEASGNKNLSATNRVLLELYRQGKAYREDSPPPGN
jgi:protein O-mannosyl-transferase